jgi:uncharacterized protein
MKRWLAALCLVFSAAAWAGDGLVALPRLQARVTDLTQTLSADQRSTLESSLAAIEGSNGPQVAVLLLPSTKPETIEEFGIRLAEAWKIGHKGVDNGVIVIVAKDDRRVRIEVGYGLEGPLNDATCQRIIREQITPRFKNNDYYGGLQAAIDGILAAIRTETPATGDQAATQAASPIPPDRVDGMVDYFGQHENTFWLGLAALLIGITALRFFLGDMVGSSVTGGVVGVVAFFFTFSFVTALIAAGIAFLVALLGVNFIWLALLSGGSGGSGGGSGGGGFSGGGGGFGGGGSSGSW